jgi:prophage regulatory protein
MGSKKAPFGRPLRTLPANVRNSTVRCQSVDNLMEPDMSERIHRLPSALNITGLCRTSLYNALASRDFPEPVRLGKRAVGWRESDLMSWIASRQKRNAAES